VTLCRLGPVVAFLGGSGMMMRKFIIKTLHYGLLLSRESERDLGKMARETYLHSPKYATLPGRAGISHFRQAAPTALVQH
jgi:hypothetical protein